MLDEDSLEMYVLVIWYECKFIIVLEILFSGVIVGVVVKFVVVLVDWVKIIY